MDARGIAPHTAMAAAIDCGMNKPSHLAKVYFFVVNWNKHINNTKKTKKRRNYYGEKRIWICGWR